MCGRFTQYRTKEEYLNELGDDGDCYIAYDRKPIARHNVAPVFYCLTIVTMHFTSIPFTGDMPPAGGINNRSKSAFFYR